MQLKATRDRGNGVENVTVRDCDLQMISVLTALNYNHDSEAAPAPPYFRHFRFVNLDLSAGKPGSTAINLSGFSAAAHRTRDVTLGHVKLPPGAIVKVDEAEDVVLTGVTTPDGAKPAYAITNSERVSR